MNEQQKRFCEFYAQNPNATEAARKAGYSPHTAYSQGQRLLKVVEIADYLSVLQEESRKERIADIQEVRETWTDILRDEKRRASDRLHAGELLSRSAGAMIKKEETQDEAQEEDSEERGEPEIFLPFNGRDGQPNAVQLPSGEIVPLHGHENDTTLVYIKVEQLT